MSRPVKTQTRQTSKRSPGRRRADAPPRAPASLARTLVYKRVPVTMRSRLDEALLFRPEGCATIEAVAEQFKLTEHYGITPAALRTYADKLEQLVRPAVTSHLVAAVLGCLPAGYRQRLLAGSQVLLLSRIVQALTTASPSPLPVADLAKLASVLSQVAGRPAQARTAAGRTHRKRTTGNRNDTASAAAEPTQMAEAVRMLYGLSWPPGEGRRELDGQQG